MKRIILSVLCFVLLMTSAIGLVACNKEQHTHDFTEQVVEEKYLASEATCTEPAKYYYSCSCGQKGTEMFTTGNAQGHQFGDWTTEKQATETENGLKARTCTRCGHTENETIPMAPHTHMFNQQVVEGKYLATKATCTEPAKYYYSCSCCAIGEATFEHGNALDHSFTNYISDGNATCTNDGTKTAKCDRCEVSDTITDEGSKIDHTFNKQVAEGKYLATKATCTEPAKYYYSCSCCAIGEATFEHGNALDHSFTNYISDGNATCTNDGTKTAKCDRCEVSDTITDEGSKIDHTFNKQVAEGKYLATKATCTEPAKYYYSCSCGAIGETTFAHGNALDHSYSTKWSSNETYHWHAATCEHNDEVSDKAEHEFEGDVCKTCGCPKPILASEGLEFIINDDGAYSVSGIGTCKDTDIVIPSKYNDLPVKRIGEAAFRDCTNLTSVVIPDSVVSIGNKTFWGCYGLTSITIGDGVTSIGNCAFQWCKSLTNITIPDNVTSLGEQVFLQCIRLQSVTIPSSITSIPKMAFDGCSKLENVVISTGVTSIGGYAFNSCIGLKNIIIPNSITSIGNLAFCGCTDLTSVTIGKGVTSIEKWAFMGCTGLTSINYTDTKEKWNAITKGDKWDGNTGNYTIRCTDGDISK